VRNPGLQELPSLLAEAETPVEPGRLSLRVERDPGHGVLARLVEHGLHERRAHSAPAPFAKDRHPADPAVGQQTRGPYRLSFNVASDCVIAALVPFVPFQLARHPLFLDEHFFAHRARKRQRLVPWEDADRESCPHRRPV